MRRIHDSKTTISILVVVFLILALFISFVTTWPAQATPTPKLTLECSPIALEVGGSGAVTVSGNLTDGSTGLNSRNIIFMLQTGSTWEPITGTSATTDSLGHYSAVLDLSTLSAGSYQVAANFAGDASYNPVMSESVTITVYYPPTPPEGDIALIKSIFVVPEYPLGALIGMIACFAAFVVVRKTRKARAT